jgi:hypothetical protein
MKIVEYRSDLPEHKMRSSTSNHLLVNYKLTGDNSVLTIWLGNSISVESFKRVTLITNLSVKPENLPKDRLIILDGGYNGSEKRFTISIVGDIEGVNKPFSIVLTNITSKRLDIPHNSVIMAITEKSFFSEALS